MNGIYLCVPTYNGQMEDMTARSRQFASAKYPIHLPPPNASSVAPHNFNVHWCHARNIAKERGLKWFAMLHSDVGAPMYWLDTMVERAEAVGADVLSAVIPIKTGMGVTSTGLSKRLYEDENYGYHARLTVKQIRKPGFPQIFDAAALSELMGVDPERRFLLNNTGCMIVNLERDWGDVCFKYLTRIVPAADGSWAAEFFPEDWQFSLDAAWRGMRVYSTILNGITHHGDTIYSIDRQWGAETDPEGQANNGACQQTEAETTASPAR